MSVMTGKYPSLVSHAAQVSSSTVDSIVPLMNTPFDAMIAQIYGDKRTELIKDRSLVEVGDLAFAGNCEGTVTAILTDGEVAPAVNRIQVTYRGQVVQNPADESIANRVVEYNIIDAVNADADGTNKTKNPNAISGEGVVFLRLLD